MDKSGLIDAALEKLMGDMDDMEGSGAMSHSLDECPDPLGCTMHDADEGAALTPEPKGVTIEVKGGGLPSLDGVAAEDKAEDGLSLEEQEELRKLIGK